VEAKINEELGILPLVALDRGYLVGGDGAVVDELFEGLHGEGVASFVEVEEVPRGQYDKIPVEQVEKKALHLHDKLWSVTALAAAIEFVGRGDLAVVFLHLGCSRTEKD
jgi:hypothetical protein